MKALFEKLLTALLLTPLAALHAADRPNVLFIAVDDLNHWVGHLGRNPQTKTPNLDRLAAMGVTFSQKYYDMHPLADIQLPPTKQDDLSDVPPAGVKMAKPTGDHAAVLASGRWKEAVQAYLATISYLDGQIGRVLDAYDKSPHKKNTIIVLWGDHGWHLGEKEHWRKFSLWEEATRAPFIWVVPGVTKPGGVCKSPVDFMSVYPTLCDLAALPKPAWLEGDNIKPLLADPAAAWKGVGITTFGQDNHAVRTDRWRYIRYADGSEELYDHSNDEYEWTNLANNPEHAELKAELAKHLPKTNLPDPVSRERGKKGKNKKANAGKAGDTKK